MIQPPDRSNQGGRYSPTNFTNVASSSLVTTLSDRLKVPIASSISRLVKREKLWDQGKVLHDVKGVVQGVSGSFVRPMIEAQLLSACSADIKKNLRLSLGVIVDYSVLFGFRPDRFDRSETLAHWQECSVSCGWIKFIKYKLAAFMSHFLGGVLPEKPFSQEDHPGHLVGGTLGRFMSKIMCTPRATSFTVGILYSKKGMPRPSKFDLEQAKMDTKKVLTTTHFMGDQSHSWYIKEEIRRTCREVFKQKIRIEDLHHPYAPSVRANYTNARKEFGTLGTLFEDGFLDGGVEDESSIRQLYDHVVGYNDNEEMEEEESRYTSLRPEFRKAVQQRYSKIYESVRAHALKEVADVELVALPEALKVRVISKGPALTYFALKPVQKFLLRQMKKHRCFKLVGETVTISFLNDVFKGTSGLFHSLDYKSATDFLNPEMSQCAVDEICDSVGMPDDLRILFHKALTGHLVEGVPQVWGQLMGSIVSFIVLCIVNMSVIRHAYERSIEARSLSIDSIPAVVNGDDGLVQAPECFSKLWEDSALVAGLVPSIGKVYTHHKYANINSTSFRVFDGKFELVKYVNMGLLMGLTRSGGKTGVVGFGYDSPSSYDSPFESTVGARHHALMDSCPFDLRLKVHEAFLKHNSKNLKQAHIPWYIPEELGGVGLKPLIGYTGDDIDDLKPHYLVTSSNHICGPSRLDVFCAYGLIDRRDKKLSVGKVPALQPIQTRSIWQPSLTRLNSREKRVEISAKDAGFLDVSTFYLVPSAVMKKIDSNPRNARLHTNQRVWAYLYRLHSDFSSSGDQLFL